MHIPKGRWRWIAGGVGAVAVGALAGPYIFIHFIEGPPPSRLSLPKLTTTTVAAASSTTAARSATTSSGVVAGIYSVGAGSEAGYRVDEVLIGQSTTAVGRTSDIWGSVTITGSAVSSGTFTVDMASVVRSSWSSEVWIL